MSKIKLLDVQFIDVKLKSKDYNQSSTNSLKEPKLQISCLHNTNDSNKYGIRFDLELKNSKFSIKIVSVAHFECSDIVDKAFLDSDFAMINSPAIAFPYVRAYVSNIILSSGFNPVFLPTFNFVAMASSKRLKQAKETE